jgi:pre-mRNA-splicing factor 38A
MMANRATHRADATALLDDRGYSGPLVRGQNPALVIEKAVRDRITGSLYWLEQCYGLNAASLCDRAAELQFLGGTYGGMGKPTPFLCLLFKMLQLVPDKEIILAYLNWKDVEDESVKKEEGEEIGEVEKARTTGEFKYLRALAAFYIRLTWEPVEIYKTLEPLLADFRKLKRRTREGFSLTHVDQFIDDLLTKDRVCATSLWKLPSRTMLEDLELLEPRESPLGDEIDELDAESEGELKESEDNRSYKSGSSDRRRDRSSSRSYRSDRSRSRSERSRSRSVSRSRSRSRSRSMDD